MKLPSSFRIYLVTLKTPLHWGLGPLRKFQLERAQGRDEPGRYSPADRGRNRRLRGSPSTPAQREAGANRALVVEWQRLATAGSRTSSRGEGRLQIPRQLVVVAEF
jgi:hypothetical protein